MFTFRGKKLNSATKRITRFGLLAALSLVLGYLDRAVPLSALLGGVVPGIKLGLANTVLLYAVYLMDWRSSVLLMLVKVLLSGFLFGSLSAILYSLSGGILSLFVMLWIRRNPARGALVIAVLAALSEAALLLRVGVPRGPMLLCAVVIALACAAGIAAWRVIRRRPDWGVVGTSLAGAVAHNIGQVLMAAAVLRTPGLLYTYLPVLIGVGAAVGAMTGLIAQRVFRALRLTGIEAAHPGRRPGGCR
jgi:heptaprenyl diphosphate synthase